MPSPLHLRLFWLGLITLLLASLVSTSANAQADPPPLLPWASNWDLRPATRDSDLPGMEPTNPALVKSLGDATEILQHHPPPASAAAWRERRAKVDRALRHSLGLDPLPERTPLNARILATHDRGDLTVATVVFESRPGFPVSANLYRPKSSPPKRRPAILSPIGHFLSAGKTARDVQARCLHLARMGYVVLTYDAIGQGERMIAGNIHHDAGYALLPLGETIAGWMVWDSMRAIDFLLSLEDVDPSRLGITGNSGGGLNSLLTAALDTRIHSAAVVGFTFEFRHWLKYGGTHCTCTHFPGIFPQMEWFEIAGLIAPRGLLMLQGENDGIFPVTGARRAAEATTTVYRQSGADDQVRFVALAKQPHAFTRPFREVMYEWMSTQLGRTGLADAGVSPVTPPAEDPTAPWPEKDPRLLVDPERAWFPQAPTVVELARRRALDLLITALPAPGTHSAALRQRLDELGELTDSGESRPSFLNPRLWSRTNLPNGSLEKVSFTSEDGVWIPGLFWRPPTNASGTPARVVVVAHDRGKSAVARSNFVEAVLATGRSVFAMDLRGRGETLGHYGPRHDTNFRLVANQILGGQPLAGRRAFDLRRSLDYLATRPDVTLEDLSLVGLGDEALTAVLATITDSRVRRLALGGHLTSFLSQMRCRPGSTIDSQGESWNDPQLDGRVDTGDYAVDFGAVIPSILTVADSPDLLALVAPRLVLLGRPRDADTSIPPRLSERWATAVEVLRAAPPDSAAAVQTLDQPLDGSVLVRWLATAPVP